MLKIEISASQLKGSAKSIQKANIQEGVLFVTEGKGLPNTPTSAITNLGFETIVDVTV